MLTPVGSVFVDTNVLLYSVDPRDSRKRARAGAWLDYLWRHAEGRLSSQVLHEFYANAVRKTGVPMTQAREMFIVFTRWTPSGVDSPLIERAWYWMDNAQLSYWTVPPAAANRNRWTPPVFSAYLRALRASAVRSPLRTLPKNPVN